MLLNHAHQITAPAPCKRQPRGASGQPPSSPGSQPRRNRAACPHLPRGTQSPGPPPRVMLLLTRPRGGRDPSLTPLTLGRCPASARCPAMGVRSRARPRRGEGIWGRTRGVLGARAGNEELERQEMPRALIGWSVQTAGAGVRATTCKAKQRAVRGHSRGGGQERGIQGICCW